LRAKTAVWCRSGLSLLEQLFLSAGAKLALFRAKRPRAGSRDPVLTLCLGPHVAKERDPDLGLLRCIANRLAPFTDAVHLRRLRHPPGEINRSGFCAAFLWTLAQRNLDQDTRAQRTAVEFRYTLHGCADRLFAVILERKDGTRGSLPLFGIANDAFVVRD